MAFVQDLRKICESSYFDARMGPWVPEPNAQQQKRIPFVVLCGTLELPERQPRCVLFSSASLEYVPSCSTLDVLKNQEFPSPLSDLVSRSYSRCRYGKLCAGHISL